jgi:hypothetical protein
MAGDVADGCKRVVVDVALSLLDARGWNWWVVVTQPLAFVCERSCPVVVKVVSSVLYT